MLIMAKKKTCGQVLEKYCFYIGKLLEFCDLSSVQTLFNIDTRRIQI